MSAANPLPSSETPADKRAYEPSMEEILASIRRIIADDQSLPGRVVPASDAPQTSPIKRDLPRQVPMSDAGGPPVMTAPTPSFVPPVVRRTPDRTPVPPLEGQEPVNAQKSATEQYVAPKGAAPSAPVPVEPDLPLDSGMAHGSIAAPQFAMPDGPIGDDQIQQRAQARAAFYAQPPRADVSSEPAPPSFQERHDPVAAQPPAEPEDDEALYASPIEPAAVPDVAAEKAQLLSAATDSAVSAAFNMLAASRLADNSDELMTLAREMIRPLLRSWIDDNLPSMVERMVRAEIERVARGGR